MASPTFTVSLQNTPQVLSLLESVIAKAKKSVVKKAVTAAGKVLVKDMRKRVKRRRGWLRKSIRARVKVKKGGVGGYVVVGPGRRAKGIVVDGREIQPTKYAHLVEGGTAPHHIGAGAMSSVARLRGMAAMKVGARHPGAKARPFVEPAIRSKGPEMVEAMVKKIQEIVLT